MDRFLALPARERAQAFDQMALTHGLASGSIEKDLWVTLALRELFALPALAQRLTFKGGTSLSKVWGLIDRFSEDVDLTLDRELLDLGDTGNPEAARSATERRRRLDAIRATSAQYISDTISPLLGDRLASVIRSTERWSLAVDPDESQTLLFAYPRPRDATSSGYVQPVVRLEFGARSDPWPVEWRPITALIATELPALFDPPAATVSALTPVRTFLEKMLLLHEESFRPASKPRRPRLSRHYFDLTRLIQAGVGEQAAVADELFARVALHRSLYFRQSWVDYDTLVRGQIRIVPDASHEDEWRRDYDAMQGVMLPGHPPTFDDILTTVRAFERRFNRAE